MSPVREMKDGRGKCIFYGSLQQETGGLTPIWNSLANNAKIRSSLKFLLIRYYLTTEHTVAAGLKLYLYTVHTPVCSLGDTYTCTIQECSRIDHHIGHSRIHLCLKFDEFTVNNT